MISRRTFMEHGSLALAGLGSLTSIAARAASARSGPLGLPIGLQLYTVRPDTTRDLVGTLTQVAAIGYREVELAGYYNRSAKDLRSLLNGLGLAVPSTHHALRDLLTDTQKQIDYVAELGVSYLVIPFPATADNRFDNQPSGAAKTISNSTKLDDWKWMAAQLNRIGELSRKAGIRTGYHNHNIDFRSIDGVVAYDQLINSTDPALVTFELDVGWVVAAGADPVAYLKKYKDRISMLHIKDVKAGVPMVTDDMGKSVTTELGRGQINWHQVFAAAPKQLTHYFVEQEQFERPIMESVRMDYDYLQQLRV
jgi:sugar phosphate isomerase/epimerase